MALFSSVTLFEGIALAIAFQFLLLFWVLVKQAQQKKLTEQLGERIQQILISQLHQLHIDLSQSYQTSQQFINEKIAQGQLATQQLISDAIQRQMADVREQMTHSFKHHASHSLLTYNY